MPPEGEEVNYARVGFLGQVPVRCIGEVKQGDYILASGNNDGLSIARSKEELNISDYDEIIGVAWEDSGKDLMNIVNVAIGLSSNDLADKVGELEKRTR